MKYIKAKDIKPGDTVIWTIGETRISAKHDHRSDMFYVKVNDISEGEDECGNSLLVIHYDKVNHPPTYLDSEFTLRATNDTERTQHGLPVEWTVLVITHEENTQ